MLTSYFDKKWVEKITTQELTELCASLKPYITRFYKVTQPKIVDKDNIIIKFFYPKRKKFSSDKIKPYAMRFCDNITRLRKAGYLAPNIIKVLYCAEQSVHVVYYEKIIGDDVRYLVEKKGQFHLLHEVAALLAKLHKDKILFSSIHLENLLYTPQGKLALIDTGDVRFKKGALFMPYFRYRNLTRLFREPLDKVTWQTFGIENFMQTYFQHTDFTINYPLTRLAKIFS